MEHCIRNLETFDQSQIRGVSHNFYFPTGETSKHTYPVNETSATKQEFCSSLNCGSEVMTNNDEMQWDCEDSDKKIPKIEEKPLTVPLKPLNRKGLNVTHEPNWNLSKLHLKIVDVCRDLSKQPGIHSVIQMKAAGFRYTNVGDSVICDICSLTVSNWTSDMQPFTIHAMRSPACPFVRSILPVSLTDKPSSPTAMTIKLPNSTTDEQEQPCKRMKIEVSKKQNQTEVFSEVDSLKQARQRSFSIWPHLKSPTQAEMINAGFFHCNVGDRVICIYCNLICQQWISQKDDPAMVHKTLSPRCPYVRSYLMHRETDPVRIINDNSNGNSSSQIPTTDSLHSSNIVPTTPCHYAFSEIPKRHASFEKWPSDQVPSVDDLVRAGFFYTGTQTVVTCFYCNGSLQNWGPNDNPTIEHARWFPYCAYAKQLCGPELYRKIEESKRHAQERAKKNNPSNNASSNCYTLEISDESTLSRYIASRLDLPISQRLLNQGYKLSVIKRCWEDQLRLKKGDFAADTDLLIACMILQKQIDHINGKKDNIVVPSIRMQQIFEQETSQLITRSSASTLPATDSAERSQTTVSSNTEPNVNVSGRTLVENAQETSSETAASTSSQSVKVEEKSSDNSCVLCMSEDKQLACIPCGHFVTCVPCGHSLKTCPICRRNIDAFVRIYT